MKLGATLTLIGLGGMIAAFAAATGCSEDSSTGATGGSETGKTVPEETGSPTTSTEERTYAVNKIFLGEADRAGNKSPNAWKAYGYNLDGLITTVVDKNSPGLGKVCKLSAGAQAKTHEDGDQGTDNSFGRNILTLLDPFTPTPSNEVNSGLEKGDFTIMLKVKGLTDDPAQTATGLSGTILVGAKFSDDENVKPTFTTADDWPYLDDPSAQVPVTGAYINNGTFVNGKGGARVKLSLNVQGQSLNLTINKALITFKVNPADKSLADGTIAGVVNTAELADGIKVIAGRFSKDLCQGTTVDGIINSIKQASDMLADGTNDPTKPCDGISIGLGFTAKQIGTPTKGKALTTPTDDPCAPGAGDQDAGAQQ